MARLVTWETRRNSLLEPTIESINGIEAAIRWAELEVPQNLRKAMHDLAYIMAVVNQVEARKMSAGPVDPYAERPELAWRTPSQGIRRITGNYYNRWQVRNIRPGVWQLFNDSREAYFIEFGISEVGWAPNRYVPARRIRRPVRKMSLRRTMEYMMRTHAYHRIWVDAYANPKFGRHRGRGFTQIVQSPGGVAGHARWVNVSEHEARGVIRRVVRAGQQHNYRRYVRQTSGGWQVRRRAEGGGSYTGPMLGRRLP